MAKSDEIAYYERQTADGRRHADGKPFTDEDCGGLLIGLGQVMTLLPRPPAHVLDVGCGTGWTSEFLARAGYRVTGLDISPAMIEASRRLRSLPGLDFVAADFEHMTFDRSFDAVLFFGSLHHSENPEAALAACRNALTEGGVIVLMEPGEGHEKAEHSKTCAREFGLTERSLPPVMSCGMLQKLGFRDLQALPMLSVLSALLRQPTEQRSAKYRLAARMLGTHVATALQAARSSRNVAIVTARR